MNDGQLADVAHDSTMKVHQSSRLLSQASSDYDEFLHDTPTPRQPTAGSIDSRSAKERQKILKVQAMHLYVIQCALLTILFCILAYWILPDWAAPMVSLLILATGIGSAIYLSQL
jgi:hypothetical protein